MTYRFFSLWPSALLSATLLCAPSMAQPWQPRTMERVPVQLDKTFANQSVQQQYPKGFILQREALNFVRAVNPLTERQALHLLSGLMEDDELSTLLARWSQLDVEQQRPLLVQLLARQTQQATGLSWQEEQERTFVLSNDGRTLSLNPEQWAELDPIEGLAWVIYYGRLAFQSQWDSGLIAQGFIEGRQAEAALTAVSSGDYWTLNHHYEAARYTHLVVGELFDWQVTLANIGTVANQFTPEHRPVWDLMQAAAVPIPLLDQFNAEYQKQLEEQQPPAE
ncbi:MAG: hypothetical protein R3Y10_04905 [Ferrimonas sp.]